jgi:hypothetical protein
MAISIYLKSAVEQKEREEGPSGTFLVNKGYSISVYVAEDTAPDVPLGSKSVLIADDTVANMKAELKDKLRNWWTIAQARYNKEQLVNTHAQDAINELLAE